ncbi:MAG: hypothetical protein LUI12_11220 [Clostridiales bacterium]|nr:hypothetical protein [Clostridiales bacterium]
MDSEKKEEKSTRWIYSVAITFMLLFYAPLELFFDNMDEFWYDYTLLLPVMFGVFVASCVAGNFILFLFERYNRKIYHFLMAACILIYVGTYIQGNFLVKNLPALDGSPVDWNAYPYERIKSAILWIGLIVAMCVMVKSIGIYKLLKGGRILLACMTCVLFITLVTVAITNQGFSRKYNSTASTKNLYEFSENQNFIILLLDAVDGEAFNQKLEENPEYLDVFQDFTYYRDAMGVYSFTKHSIPFILSGDWYENDEPFSDYLAEVYGGSDFFADLEAQNYKLGIYEEELMPDSEIYDRFDNVLPYEYGTNNYFAFIRWNIQMTGFRYAPWELKRFCFVNPDEFKDLKNEPDEASCYTADDIEFYKMLQESEISYTSSNVFKFMHINGAHLPWELNGNVELSEDATYETEIESCITITQAYLEKLKEAEIYDDAVIIVMADHGYKVGDNVGEWRQNPLLLIKGAGEKHDLEISDAPISYVDLQEAYSRLMAGGTGTDIFDYKEGDYRERRFLLYEYNVESPMYEYIQSGKVGDRDTLLPTGQVYELDE